MFHNTTSDLQDQDRVFGLRPVLSCLRPHHWLRGMTERACGLAAFYDIWPGNGSVLFFDGRRPHGTGRECWKTGQGPAHVGNARVNNNQLRSRGGDCSRLEQTARVASLLTGVHRGQGGLGPPMAARQSTINNIIVAGERPS